MRHIFRQKSIIPSEPSSSVTATRDVIGWAKDIADALEYIHGQGIVHRDLKLENILLSLENVAKVADVGVSKEAKAIMGTMAGTPTYLAPEVMKSCMYDYKADVYSFGIMLWEMWYGKRALLDVGGDVKEFYDKAIEGVSRASESTNLPQDLQDDLLFNARAASDGVRSRKTHQLHMVHKDTARTDIIDSLQEDSVLITQELAMKFSPTQYRATQADFFAVTIMEHVLKTLKQEHSELTRAVYHRDNVGYYHCANTILASKILRERTNMDLYRIDFSDPHGGKGPCERKATQIKTHVKQYTNQSHSITTPAGLKKAIEFDEGIVGVRVSVVPVSNTTMKTKSIKWEGISSLSNFEITAAGVKAFQA
ncbi:Mitogen-activated protein kinase kinase kinase 12 [Stylophora pistillata]|uniref:Mitogen-activated protein kinase kinase kinase 12 n=1 Tax=Stylophora pistillata TaxID=50429 RepID=A0A2B4REW5_STYPI|nr:Mitogen-activated protein kinase kinase kinase 12 [Stylophora pistillata]